ncbi:DDE-type integrase/transposase/recombinase [Winogradskyella sp.]|uniref:DDE-type integrase/transposase/recombinase n=1 Tax=Winogradskyella sp. TaxID=1883156 RepID=UPI003AB26A6B
MRTSWDTSIKHLARHGLLEAILTSEQIAKVPKSNLWRWKHEQDDKYLYSEINQIIKQEIELIKRLNQSSKIKKLNKSYFKLHDTFHEVISTIKGIKAQINNKKELIVNTIEQVKGNIPIQKALKVFNISRSTYENYKTIIIHQCDVSYFKWCTKRFPNQLLPKEVETIKHYMTHKDYKHWSKSSIYLRAIRNNAIHCGLSTFYKYCRLLGYGNLKSFSKKDTYKPLITSRPNEVWCADVTIFKTEDHTKHYIHILMDHYSKKIIGCRIERSSSGKTIRALLQNAFEEYRPNATLFLTDGGSENVNSNVSSFLESTENKLIHRIAQRNVVFSNSMIEAFNKVLKHQFLYPRTITNGTALNKVMAEVLPIYNNQRPQLILGGNTPHETFNGKPIYLGQYRQGFKGQKAIRIIENQRTSCKKCN